MLDDLAWLYIEQIVYKLEIPIRPALEDVRMDYAEAFFAGEYKLSRQEWMSKNQLVYTCSLPGGAEYQAENFQ